MRKITVQNNSTILTLALFLASGHATLAQTAAEEGENRPLFQSHDTMTVRIEAPMTTLMKQQPDEEYLDGTFSYVDASGQEHSLDLKLQTRGRYRRKKEICSFAPIRLNFRKEQVQETEFAGQDKLKLVTHCQTRRTYFEQLLLREYLAYRILQTLTDKSFSVRLMHITYVDSEDDGESITRYAFVIEDEDHLADRIGLARYKERGIKVEQLDQQQGNLVSVYQYLIGNTDFSLILGPADSSCCHNAVLFSAGAAPFTPIPYDFDFAGIVDAPYAEPNPRLKIKNVTSRLYRGRCLNNEVLDGTFAHFQEKESEIRGLVGRIDGLDEKNQKDVDKYLDGFFKDISDPKQKQRKFINQCN